MSVLLIYRLVTFFPWSNYQGCSVCFLNKFLSYRASQLLHSEVVLLLVAPLEDTVPDGTNQKDCQPSHPSTYHQDCQPANYKNKQTVTAVVSEWQVSFPVKRDLIHYFSTNSCYDSHYHLTFRDWLHLGIPFMALCHIVSNDFCFLFYLCQKYLELSVSVIAWPPFRGRLALAGWLRLRGHQTIPRPLSGEHGCTRHCYGGWKILLAPLLSSFPLPSASPHIHT